MDDWKLEVPPVVRLERSVKHDNRAIRQQTNSRSVNSPTCFMENLEHIIAILSRTCSTE